MVIVSIELLSTKLRELGAFATSTSIYVAACGTCGGVAYLCAPSLGFVDALRCAFAGALVPLFPLLWLCNSDWWISWSLRSVKKWEDDGLILKTEAKSQREAILKSMRRHRFGSKS